MDMIIDKDMISISYYSNNEDTQIVLSYIYDNLKNVDGYCITNTKRVDNKDFSNKTNNFIYMHKIIPVNGNYKIDNIDITIEDYEIAKDKIAKINYKLDYFIIKKLVLKSCNKENILKFVENAINVKEKESSELFDKNFSNKNS